jgi:hypothetical protein
VPAKVLHDSKRKLQAAAFKVGPCNLSAGRTGSHANWRRRSTFASTRTSCTRRETAALFAHELDLLRPQLATSPAVVHPQSGTVLTTSPSSPRVPDRWSASISARWRQLQLNGGQNELGVAYRYVVGQLPGAPLQVECADLVYTGKGALIWIPDL